MLGARLTRRMHLKINASNDGSLYDSCASMGQHWTHEALTAKTSIIKQLHWQAGFAWKTSHEKNLLTATGAEGYTNETHVYFWFLKDGMTFSCGGRNSSRMITEYNKFRKPAKWNRFSRNTVDTKYYASIRLELAWGTISEGKGICAWSLPSGAMCHQVFVFWIWTKTKFAIVTLLTTRHWLDSSFCILPTLFSMKSHTAASTTLQLLDAYHLQTWDSMFEPLKAVNIQKCMGPLQRSILNTKTNSRFQAIHHVWTCSVHHQRLVLFTHCCIVSMCQQVHFCWIDTHCWIVLRNLRHLYHW